MSVLLERLQGWLAGNISLADLLEAVERSREEARSLRARLYEGLGASWRHQVEPELRRLEGAFDAYEQSLDRCSAGQGDAGELSACLARLAEAQVLYREAAWAARGPSSHPGANHLLWALSQGDDEELHEAVATELLRVEHGGGDLPPQLAERWPDYGRLVGELADALEADGPFEELVSDLQEWARAYTAEDVAYLSRRYSGGPTPLPGPNVLLNCARLWMEGSLPRETVALVAQDVFAWLEEHDQAGGELEDLMIQVESASSADELEKLAAAVTAWASANAPGWSRIDVRDHP